MMNHPVDRDVYADVYDLGRADDSKNVVEVSFDRRSVREREREQVN